MLNTKDCLQLIARAKRCAVDPESAYLMRSRLLRAVLAVGHLVARREGLSNPITPEAIESLRVESAPEAAAVAAASHVLALSRQLCQPSEALDARWKAGWSELQPALVALEERLVSLESKDKRCQSAS